MKNKFFHVAVDIVLIFIKRWESILEPTCIYIRLEPTLLKYWNTANIEQHLTRANTQNDNADQGQSLDNVVEVAVFETFEVFLITIEMCFH